MNSIKQNDLSEFFSDSTVAMFVITPDHKVVSWNESCEKLTGINSNEVLNTNNHWLPFYKECRPCLVDIVIDGNYSALPELYEKYGKSQISPDAIYGEGWFENLGGKDRYILFSAFPIFNSSGELVAAFETLQDITELEQTQVETKKLIAELNITMTKIESLKGFIPMCASCKDIRNTDGTWTTFEVYFCNQYNMKFSHGICPKCAHSLYPEIIIK